MTGMRAWLLVAGLCAGNDLVYAQSRSLVFGSDSVGSLAAGAADEYIFSANTGDLISGSLTLRAAAGSVTFLDANGSPFRQYVAHEPPQTGELRAGFVAPRSGAYRVRVAVDTPTTTTYTLRLNRVVAEERRRSLQTVAPRMTYESARIRQLTREMQNGDRDAEEKFWRDAAQHAPLLEPLKDSSDLLATFVWKSTFPTQNVLLLWPPTTQGRTEEYALSNVAGTDVWYKTIRVHRDSRFSYMFSPNDLAAERFFTMQRDPLNTRAYPEKFDPWNVEVQSVFELPDAPDDQWARRTPPRRGKLVTQHFKSALLQGDREITIYTPPDYAVSAERYPLVILFDGAAYLHPAWTQAADTLDNLIADHRIRPPVVCFVDTAATRSADLGSFRESFGTAIAEELLPMLRAAYPIETSAAGTVVGGYSSGGKTAAHLALRYPGMFGNVLSQSGSFNFAEDAPGSPEPNALARMYARAERLPIKFYLDYGTYERLPNADRPIDEIANSEGIIGANRHFRDVLIAKGYDVVWRESGTQHGGLHWRATLADGLMTLLKPRPTDRK